MEKNSSLWKSLVGEHPVCTAWKEEAEGAIYQLASILFVVGFMGGSGFFGLLYVFSLLGLGFLCSAVWAWVDVCAADIFSWNFVLFVICFMQFIHIAYQVHSITFAREFQVLYSSLFKPLGIPVPVFRTIALSSEVVSLEKEHCYAMQGKTSIDRLSMLVSGRIRVTVDGEFLHYILPFQFLDSPEWDSLRPTEEGIFQHRYISRLFSILIGSDIADKLYALNDRVYTGKKHHYDIRLPNYYQMSSPDLSRSPLTEQFRNSRQHCNQ